MTFPAADGVELSGWYVPSRSGAAVVLLHDAAAAVPVPMLLIAAGSLPDEAHAARYVQEGSPSTVAVWVAPGTAHTRALRVHPAEWERRVVTFLDAATGPKAASEGR